MTEPDKNGVAASPLSKEGNKTKQFIAGVTASIIVLSSGMMSAWTSPAMARIMVDETEKMNLTECGEECREMKQDIAFYPVLTSSEMAWVGSIMTIGGLVGCATGGMISDTFGRKSSLIFLFIPSLTSWLLLLLGVDLLLLFAGRFLGGLVFGAASVIVPTYLSEIAEPSIRGQLGFIFQLEIVIGIVFMYTLGLIPSLFHITLICCVIPILFVLLFSWAPESPSYLMSKKKGNEAKQALEWLRGPFYDVSSEIERIDHEVNSSLSAKSASINELFCSPVSRRGIFISLSLMFFQQASGINAALFYAHGMFEQSGAIDPNTGSILVGVLNVVASCVALIVIDRLGRRLVMYITVTVTVTGLLICCLHKLFHVSILTWIPAFGIFTYSFGFNVGLGPVPWLMMSELFPNRLRSIASSITASFCWMMAFLVTKFYPICEETFGMAPTFLAFALITSLGIPFTVFFLPETKGKTVEEILIELGEKPTFTGIQITKNDEPL